MAEEPVELRIFLLGGFRVSLGDQEIPPSRWRLTKARNLVKLLALTPGHRLHREQMIELLWPEFDPDSAANNLHQMLHVARRILEPSGVGHYLPLHEGTVSLCPDGPLSIDFEAFQSAVARAKESGNIADIRLALELYSGDLLPDDLYEDWASEPRLFLHQEHQKLGLALASLLERSRDYAAAIEALQSIHRDDPACEEAHVGMMRCYALVGQRQQALRLYQVLKEVLRRELEVEPSPESTHLYQEILTGQYPPRAAVADQKPPHNLPHQLTSFIGRRLEIAQVGQLLAGSRLVTLTGAGGVGKTRLALQLAEEQQDKYPQGVWLVDLAPLSEPQFVLQAIAAVFGVQETAGRNLTRVLLDFLSEKQLLLLLDNCEHLIDPCARLAEQILNTCPKVHILATSREVLAIAGERLFLVPALPIPGSSQVLPPEKLVEIDAVRLFIERAATALPDFRLTDANSTCIVQICQQLDGLPLALELAAGRVRTMSLQQITARLEDVFNLLVGGSRTALPRHQTLFALIDWSYNLLSEVEQRLFQRLSVFEGGWTMEAAESICQAENNSLAQLINKSLVVAWSAQGEVCRYSLLQTIRQYAQHKIVEAGEIESLRDRHLDYFIAWAWGITQKLRTAQTPELLDCLEDEIHNLRLALGWALEEAPGLRVGKGLQLASELLLYWFMRGPIGEGLDWLKKGLSLLNGEKSENRHIRGEACLAVGVLLEDEDRETACQFLEESVRCYQEAGDPQQAAHALCQLGHAWANVDPNLITPADLERAHFYGEQGLALCRQSGNPWSLAFGLCMNAVIASNTDLEVARQMTLESHALFQETGDRLFLEVTTEVLGTLALLQGDYASATRYGQQALALARALKSKVVLMLHLSLTGMAAWYHEDYPQMSACFQEKLALSQELGDKASMAISLRSLGMAALRQGQVQQTAAFFLEGVRRDQEAGNAHLEVYLPWFASLGLAADQPLCATRLVGAFEARFQAGVKGVERWDLQELARCRAALQAQLGEEAFTTCIEEGKTLPEGEALTEALAIGKEASQAN